MVEQQFVNRVYSTIDDTILLFSLQKKEFIEKEREDHSPTTEPLQMASKRVQKGTHFPSHRHNKIERITDRTQEAWVVIQGSIRARFYDIDDSLRSEVTLRAGDAAIVFQGGHGFDVLEDDTLIYEFKTGPYFGVGADKVLIE